MSLRHCRRGEGGSNEFNAIVTVQLYGLAHAMLRVHYSSCVLRFIYRFLFVSFPFHLNFVCRRELILRVKRGKMIDDRFILRRKEIELSPFLIFSIKRV